VLNIGFVEHFPVRDLEAVIGGMPLAELVGESALRVPTHQAGVVLAQLFQASLSQLGALGVTPEDLVGILGPGDRGFRLEQPGWNRAEIQDHRVPCGRLQEVERHWIDEAEVPGSSLAGGRLQLRDGQPRIGQPGHIPDVIGAQLTERGEGLVVDARPSPQQWIDNHLQGGGGLQYKLFLVPVHLELGFLLSWKRHGERPQRQPQSHT